MKQKQPREFKHNKIEITECPEYKTKDKTMWSARITIHMAAYLDDSMTEDQVCQNMEHLINGGLERAVKEWLKEAQTK